MAVAVSAAALHGSAGLEAQERPTLQPSEYARWETLGAPTLGPFGRVVAHTVQREDDRAELRVIAVEGDTTWTFPWGQDPEFAANGRWLAFLVGHSPAEEERLEAADEDVHTTAHVLDLDARTPREVGTVRSFAFDPTGRFLALHGYAPSEPDGAGANLRVLDLDGGTEVGFSNVDEFAWAAGAPLLAMTLATGLDEGNGVQVYDGRNGAVRGLDASESTYSDLAWHDETPSLAVLRSVADGDGQADVLAWRDALDSETGFELAARSDAIADSLQVVGTYGPEWSEDGTRLSVGLRPRPAEEAEENEDEAPAGNGESTEEDVSPATEPATVQIWHSKDVRIIPQQQVRATSDERSVLLASWEISTTRVTQVGQDLLSSASIHGDRGFEVRSDVYPWGTMFGRRFQDVWTVDLATGDRSLAAERVRYYRISPQGRYVTWFDGEDHQLVDLTSGDTVSLSGAIDAEFANQQWDTPTDGLTPPYGFAGWVGDEQAVLLYTQFDVWRVTTDGQTADQVADGAEGQVIHRMLDLFPDEDTYRDSELWFNLRGEWTEDRGFAKWTRGSGYEELVMEPKAFRSVRRADSADVLVYRRESRTDAPDYFISDLNFSDPVVVTESNPFMDEYAWTRTELVDYENAEGTSLHGVLMYPAGYDASRQYPMIVYAYELMTPQMHFWQGPSERSYYNYTTWTQQGYFVLLPDIVFRARDPGVSTAETMDAAIRAVDAKGVIDRDRVGFIGHSWGGYEAAYLAARTDLFATTVAGAPLTDFVSFMGSIHWNPGIAEVDHWENGQARMAVPYWEDMEAHERNSPIHGVHTMTTPILMAHGDADGVVEFFQATEFYNFARRAEKEMVLLVYEGEDHGFRQRANQIDYHRRILEWFDHYLKGEPAAEWITHGVTWADHQDERKRVADPG